EVKEERILESGAEARGRTGDVDRAIVGRHRDARRGLAALAGKLLVEEQASIRTELDDQRGNVHDAGFGSLKRAGNEDRTVGRDRHPAAWIRDIPRGVLF